MPPTTFAPFSRGPGPHVDRAPITGEGRTEADVRAMLRMAQLEFAQLHPAWIKAVNGRGWAAYVAFQAGMSDAMIAEVYGVPRANVERMRRRVVERIALGEEEQVDARSEV